MRAVLLVPLACFVAASSAAKTGEQMCEGHGYGKSACEAVGCCSYDAGCNSAVGTGACGSAGVNKSAIILPTYAKGKFSATWVAGAGAWSACEKTTSVFGVVICVTKKAFQNRAKCDHIAGVLGQLLDNDADGIANDNKVAVELIAASRYMYVVASEADQQASKAPAGKGQMTGTYEAFPNSCDTPTNRGATANRSSWAAAVSNTPGSTGCDPRRDATTEEVFHLITEAAGTVYPGKWASTRSSEAGVASFKANGNCGWAFSKNWKNPEGSSPACKGQYAYNDATCDAKCVVIEGIYWSAVTWMGGLFTHARAKVVASEWLMTVPDQSMAAVLPSGQANAKTLEQGSPALFKLVSDTTSAGHKWLPRIMPDGRYTVTGAKASGSGSGSGSGSKTPQPTTAAPTARATTAAPTKKPTTAAPTATTKAPTRLDVASVAQYEQVLVLDDTGCYKKYSGKEFAAAHANDVKLDVLAKGGGGKVAADAELARQGVKGTCTP